MLVKLPKGTNPLDLEINRRLLTLAKAAGINLYIVGGYLRDAFLKQLSTGFDRDQTKDIDYAVSSGSAFTFAEHVANCLEGHFVALDEANDTARVVLSDSGMTLDFAGCVGGSIESDVRRRDFTINALVWKPSEPEKVLDLVGGLADLKALKIRAISEQAFVDDPLRVLRAYRFAASLNATIEPQTATYLARHVYQLANVACERINFELFHTLAHPCGQLIVEMGRIGVLETIFPELSQTHRVTPNAFHHLGLFDHSLDTVPQLEKRLSVWPDWVIDHVQTQLTLGVSRLAATKLACLLHDIGKPQTWVVNDDGRHTFYAHDHIGADLCQLTSERMKWSRPLERLVTKLVKLHLRPGALFHQGEPTERAIRRFYRSVGADLPELMLLAFADFDATRGPGLLGDQRISLEEHLSSLLNNYHDFVQEGLSREKLLDGNRVMELLSLPPGPIVGEILTALDEAQDFKEVFNATEAEQFVVNHYRKKYCK